MVWPQFVFLSNCISLSRLGLIVTSTHFLLRRASWLPGSVLLITVANICLLFLFGYKIIDSSLVFELFVQLFGTSCNIPTVLYYSLLVHHFNSTGHVAKFKMRSCRRTNVTIFVYRWAQDYTLLEDICYLFLVHYGHLIKVSNSNSKKSGYEDKMLYFDFIFLILL